MLLNDTRGNPALDFVTKWGEQNKLKFSAAKTQAIILTRKLKYEEPKIKINNTEIIFTPDIKILGLTIDKNLNFLKHIEQVTAKAINIYKAVSRTARAQWGLNPDIIKTIYIAVIEPILLYGSNVWGMSAHRKQVRTRLDKIARLFANLISKSHRTSSLMSGCILSGILPLDLRAVEQRELYLVKRGKPLPTLPGRELEMRASPFLLPHPALREKIKFEDINGRAELAKIDIHKTQIYTDGSKLEGKVGGAVTYWQDGRETGHAKFSLPDYCSVFQAEMVAIYRALKLMIAKKSLATAAVLSDSKSALMCLADPNGLNPIAQKIREKITDLTATGGNISFYWVKAHDTIPGNERADELAKEAATKLKGRHAYDLFPLSHAKRILRDATILEWQARYEEAAAGGTTRMFFPDVRKAHRIIKKIKMDNCLAQLLTGHGGFRSYLHKRKICSTPYCECDDQTEETVEHILLDCPRFNILRHDIENETDTNINKYNLPILIEDDRHRNKFLNYARKVIQKAGVANGANYN
ncbi:uncharacterized protein LOC123663025 [Melitaea cinxia]|uniref:uncharacterized protein LOC123663025 n=1 Tax=Melitaea cinxia TaxID=113334 RepID=UPI001E26FC4A|nr:uncharacterized protein LOC123663025 [Melitaea cinxia]